MLFLVKKGRKDSFDIKWINEQLLAIDGSLKFSNILRTVYRKKHECSKVCRVYWVSLLICVNTI